MTSAATLKAMLQKQIDDLDAQEQAVKMPVMQPVATHTLPIQQAIANEVARQIELLKPTLAPPVPSTQTPPPGQMEMVKLAAFQIVAGALKPSEMEWVQKHYLEGYPGFPQFLQSDAIKPHIQMLFETYKEFLEGKIK